MENRSESVMMTKDAFMAGIRKIVNCNDQAVTIMRETPLSNFKVVKRNSKTIRDPNPLASTMRALSHKYPIIADRTKLEFYEAPEDLYQKEKEDKHHHNKVNCKLSTLDWWLSHSPEVEIETKQTVDIINQVRNDELKSWKGVDFSKANITIAQSIMPREPVVTQKPLVEIPKGQAAQALKQALGIPNHTRIAPFTKEVEKRLENLRVKRVPAQLSLMAQIPLVQKDMQKRVTYLPMSSRVPAELANHRYMFNGSFYATANYQMTDTQVQQVSNRTINNICKVLALAIEKRGEEQGRKIIKSCKLGTLPVTDLLTIMTVKECYETKIVRAVLGMPVNMDLEEKGVEFAPRPGSTVIPMHKRSNGIPYTIYLGREEIMFKYEEIRGVFVKNGDLLSTVQMTTGRDSEIRHVIGMIKCYSRNGWGAIKATSYHQLRETAYKRGKEQPWEVLECTEEEYLEMSRGQSKTAGVLLIVDEMEFLRSSKQKVIVRNLDIYSEDGSKCLMQRPVKTFTNIDLLPQDFKAPLAVEICKYYPALRRLSSFICYFAGTSEGVKRNVMDNNWNVDNECIMLLVNAEDRQKVASTARAYLKSLERTKYDRCGPVVMGFLYCFCYGGYSIRELDLLLTFRYSSIYTIDLTLKSETSIVKYTDTGDELMVGREKIKTREMKYEPDMELRYDEYWSISVPKPEDSGLPRRTTELFHQNPSKYGPNSKFLMHINGTEVVVRRNSNMKRAMTKTIEDRLDQQMRLQTSIAMSLARKSDTTNPGPSSPKRPRVETPSESSEEGECSSEEED